MIDFIPYKIPRGKKRNQIFSESLFRVCSNREIDLFTDVLACVQKTLILSKNCSKH